MLNSAARARLAKLARAKQTDAKIINLSYFKTRNSEFWARNQLVWS
jgi:hypothetical protein